MVIFVTNKFSSPTHLLDHKTEWSTVFSISFHSIPISTLYLSIYLFIIPNPLPFRSAINMSLIIPPVLWWVYCFHVVCVRPSICPSVTFFFFNILKSYCWIFIKPCKHVHICKTNTLDKKVRARDQFY